MSPKHDSKSEGEMVEDVCREMVYVVPVLVPVNVDCAGALGMYACSKTGRESALAVSIRGSGWTGEDIASCQWPGVRSLVGTLALLQVQSSLVTFHR